MNYSQSPDLYDPLLGTDIEEHPTPVSRSTPWRRFRLVLYSLLMLTILVVSSLLSTATALPSLLGYWHSHYQIQITDIYEGECVANSPRGEGILTARDTYCVCGVLDAGEQTAHFNLSLQRSNGQRLGRVELREQPSGHFCQVLRLDAILPVGEYELRVIPRLSRQAVYGIRLNIQDPNPTV